MRLRISLDQEDFRALVRGQVVKRPGVAGTDGLVEVSLQDIGWTVMQGEILQALLEAHDRRFPGEWPE